MSEDSTDPTTGITRTARLESFSDGVIAVIITIMAFELKTPAAANFHALGRELPLLLTYVLSFTFVGIYWVNHHHLLGITRRNDAAVMWTNLHLLFWLSLIPFVTEWIGADHGKSLPAACYGAVGLGGALAYTLLSFAILRADPDNVAIARVMKHDNKGKFSVLVWLASIGLAFVSPYIAYVCFVVVALTWFVPDRRLVTRDARA
ncbi:MAG: TMEM175 family protein [Acidimicrobiales bacterium]